MKTRRATILEFDGTRKAPNIGYWILDILVSPHSRFPTPYSLLNDKFGSTRLARNARTSDATTDRRHPTGSPRPVPVYLQKCWKVPWAAPVLTLPGRLHVPLLPLTNPREPAHEAFET